MILAIDTASKAGSVALTHEGDLIFSASLNTGYTHSKTLMPMLAQMLELSGKQMSDIKGIAVSAGPGSFTGIRIGFATAKALASAQKIDFYAVPTLKALAMNGQHSNAIICPLLDARRHEVYTAIYEDQSYGLKELYPADAMPLTMLVDVLKEYDEIFFTGDGLNTYQEFLQKQFPKAVFSKGMRKIIAAHHVATIAETMAPDDLYQAKPQYIRRSEAVVKWEQAHPGRKLNV